MWVDVYSIAQLHGERTFPSSTGVREESQQSLWNSVTTSFFFFSRLEGTILAWGLMVQSVVVEKAWWQGFRLGGPVCHGGEDMVSGA